MSNLPPASIVIPSWNGARFVSMALERIQHLRGAWEAIVVDHGRMNRETEAAVAKFSHLPSVRYVGEDKQLGFAGAVNRGVTEAKHDLVAVICNDVLVEPGWLEALVAAHAADRASGRSPVLCSKIRHGGEASETKRMNFWFRVVDDPGDPDRHFFPDGSAFLFDRSVYGLPFDADYFLYQEDVYLGWRAQIRGEEVRRVPASVAENFDGGTTRRTRFLTAYLAERNRWLNYLTFLSPGTLARALPLLWLDAGIKFVAGRHRLAKLRAWAWLALFFPVVLRKRGERQRERRRPDDAFLPLLSGLYLNAPPSHPLNRGFRWLGRGLGLRLKGY